MNKPEVRSQKSEVSGPRFDADCWLSLAVIVTFVISVALYTTGHAILSALVCALMILLLWAGRVRARHQRRLAEWARQDRERRFRTP